MLVTAVGVNSQTGIIFKLLGASEDSEGSSDDKKEKKNEEKKNKDKKDKKSKFNSSQIHESSSQKKHSVASNSVSSHPPCGTDQLNQSVVHPSGPVKGLCKIVSYFFLSRGDFQTLDHEVFLQRCIISTLRHESMSQCYITQI